MCVYVESVDLNLHVLVNQYVYISLLILPVTAYPPSWTCGINNMNCSNKGKTKEENYFLVSFFNYFTGQLIQGRK